MNNLGMARPDMYRGPGMCPPDFKPPSETQPAAPSNPKKRRKTAATAANNAILPTPVPTPADLLPPPLTGYGDTIVASNPFDDTPPQNTMNMSHIGHMGMNPHHHHMSQHHIGPHGGSVMRGMNPMMMNQINNSSMVPVPHMGMNHHMNNRGNMSPMVAQMGGLSPMGSMNPNLSPMGLQHGLSNHGMNQIGPGPGRPMSNSPMPIGSPMGSSISSPLNSGSNMNGPPMGPPMHSPLPNGPLSNPGNRMNGGPMNQSQQSPHPQMGNSGGPSMMNNNGLTPINNNNNSPTTSMTGGGPQSNNNQNNLPGSNNGQNPNSMPAMGNSGGGQGMSNTNNMVQNNQHPHQMGPMMNMMSNNPSQLMGPNQGPPMGMYGGPKPMPVSAGKIYPVDTPMVFNPQNPNAPPIYPCGTCHKEVHDNDQGLLCESGCNFWFHR